MSMRRIAMSGRFAAALLVTAGLLAGSALALSDRTLGVYFDAAGTQCNGRVVPGTPAIVYILAHLDAGAPGINGFEFSFQGVPAGWSVFPVPNPDMLAIGNPFDAGVTGAFATCQRPDNGIVTLYTVAVLAQAEESDVNFIIYRRNPPSNPYFECPVVLNCDAPVFTAVCVQGVACSVNPGRPRICAYPTAIAPATWSGVKQFYR